jgi:hypothetical protein
VELVVLVREDQRLQHRINYAEMRLESDFDFLLEDGGVFDLTDPDPQTPFQPGHTYHLQIGNRDNRTTRYEIGAVVTAEQVDGGTGEDGGEDAGEDGSSEDAGTEDAGTDAGTDAGVDAGADEAGDDGPVQCPDGSPPTWDGQNWICVPACRSGYKPELKDGVWQCVPKGGGCGCGARSGPGLLLSMLLLLGLFRSRPTG